MAKVLITGCRGGIGLDVAKRLASNGHYVYATVHREESIESTRVELLDYKQSVKVIKLDILDKQDWLVIKDVDVDILINNAAIGDSGPLNNISVTRIKDVFETNVFATLSFSQWNIKKMLSKGEGRVIFIGSMAGLIPMPFLGPYSMTKYALEGMVNALRNEMKPLGINIVMINPGSFDTGFNQKNMKKRYDWMDIDNYSDDYLKIIKKEEKKLLISQLNNTKNIAKKIVKAVEASNPKKRYVAPLWQWELLPLIRLFE